MTFNARENSVDQGQPVWLYDFVRGWKHWRYTSADQDITWNTYTWTRQTIAHDKIQSTAEAARNDLTITAPATLDFATQYRVIGPSDPVLLTLRKFHWQDNDAVIEWFGRISGVSWPRQNCQITAQPATAGMQQAGLRQRVSRNCEHPLYSQGDGLCNLLASTVTVAATLTAVTSTTITAPEFATHPDGYFNGGYVSWAVDTGIYQRRSVLGHVGTTLTLLSGTYGLAVGQGLSALPGCAHTLAACKAFNNLPNYGGLAYLPSRSPFDGSPVY